MDALAKWLGEFLAPIIKPLVIEALNEFFGPDKASVSKPNAAADALWDNGVRPDDASRAAKRPNGDHP